MPGRKKKILKRKKKPIGTNNKRGTIPSQHENKISISCILKKHLHEKPQCCDEGDTKRIKYPVKFTSDNKTKGDLNIKYKTMNYKSVNRRDGLSPKEKSYVICSCQAKLSRYKLLKNLAAQAIREGKIFSVYGQCNAIRVALLDRGWVEKIPANRMNLSKIKNGTFTTKHECHGELERLFLSSLVEKYPPNFVWRTSDEARGNIIDMTKECPTIINKLKTDALWTTKQGLCSSMRRNYWFYIEDIAEVIGPRSYNTCDSGEIEGFIKDYRITACTSLLKWVLSMTANERPVFADTGHISLNVILFALSRCKEYLYRKENKDIDRNVTNVSQGQWNTFIKKYYLIIGKNDVFQTDTDNKLPLYMAYAKFLLKQMHRYRPQISCEGCHNIWIIKPAHNSRGRGIRMASKLAIITNLINKANAKYVIQKYIEEPLLIHETKFDIRQYCLVTSTYPLVIWMYKDCYLKFSSQKYNLKNYHESIHLTNNAVQRKYTNCAGRHEELPPTNMWDSDKYKDYLNRIDKGKVWDKLIYPGMKKSIIGIMLSCQDTLTVCKNRFELYGCDFILDKEYKPWLIEINSSPDLNPTTPVTAKICPTVLKDIIKVVIDHAKNPTSETGKFECIYRQPMTIPRYGGALDLFVKGYSLRNDYFYKGNIDLREVYDYEEDNIEEENNIKALLDKIKEAYDTDTVMKQPEDDSNVILKKEQETTTRNVQSDNEIRIAAIIVTEQLDELIDRVIAVVNSAKSKHEPLSTPYLVTSHFTPPQSLRSETEIEFMLDKSLSQYITDQGLKYNRESFHFSELDEEPTHQRCGLDLNPPRGILVNRFKHPDVLTVYNKDNKITSLSTDIMLEATTKLVNFINKKEKEYFQNHDIIGRN